jgi:hypothetical protein
VRFEASTKPHVHRKFEIFWTNTASTMACPNLKNGPKTGLCPLGVNPKAQKEFDNLRKTIIKYYLEQYLGVDEQMKVIYLEFWILSTVHN